MERFTGYEELKNTWTYDHARVNNFIGCFRDPYAITTESGIEMVPASIVYLQSPAGTRSSPIMSGLYKKVLCEYSRARDYMKDEALSDYIVVDEEAEAAVLALPISGVNALKNISAAFKVSGLKYPSPICRNSPE